VGCHWNCFTNSNRHINDGIPKGLYMQGLLVAFSRYISVKATVGLLLISSAVTARLESCSRAEPSSILS
jgi:hypothetical protein